MTDEKTDPEPVNRPARPFLPKDEPPKPNDEVARIEQEIRDHLKKVAGR